MVLIAIFADLLVPFDPILPLKGVIRRDTPCIHFFGCPADKPEHIMGIDGNNRDLFSRVLYGSRMSLQIGISTITFAIIIGGILGSIAGFLGGWIDTLIMRIMDVLMAFPGLLLAIAIVSVLGPGYYQCHDGDRHCRDSNLRARDAGRGAFGQGNGLMCMPRAAWGLRTRGCCSRA